MLAAPIIEGTLPACYSKENGTVVITVPFSMSRAVNRNEIKAFRLKIKNLQGSAFLFDLVSSSINYNEQVVTFETTNNDFNIGTFYKAQLAYIDRNDVTGYYSTVGIIKYTTKPALSILGLSTSKVNTHCCTYTGIYSQEMEGQDPTEKIYSYRFIVRNNNNEIVEDTGYLIHNSSNDVDYNKSQDTFSYTYDLALNEKYTITYSVKTNNGLEVHSAPYKIIEKAAIPLNTISKIYPKVDYDNGIVEIFFNINPNPITFEEKSEALEDKMNETPVKGSFILSRASEDTQYSNWETIIEFSLFAQKPSNQSWKDFTVEQGKKYKYSIQQYSKANHLYSQRLISNVIMADFEDSFLYDGNKQLKIKFNPKVSSFKKNLFEAKIDTLGSKYPFIFKNGQVEYREFPISGLISYLMDEQSFFGNNSEQFFNTEREGVNIYTPFIWLTHKNPVIEKNLQRNQYKKDYLFLYIWDTTIKNYIPWTTYLDRQTGNIEYSEYKNYSNYDKFFDPSKKYYIKQIQDLNSFDIDTIKLKTTNEVSYNISLERDFKMEVFNWLTNGKPKLFKSPTEGNFIVRLMNVSLTPDDKLGRMLHSFNSTAYEVADFNYQTLKDFDFIKSQNFKTTYFKIQTIPLKTTDKNFAQLSNIEYKEINKDGVYYAVNSLKPTAETLEFIDIADVPQGTKFIINGENIEIGVTGNLKLEIPISEIKLNESENDLLNNTGSITIGYYTDIDDSFNYISNVEIKEVIGKQFIGHHDNIISELKDTIIEPTNYHLIRAFKRAIQESDTTDVDLYKYTNKEDSSLGKLYQQVYLSNEEFYHSLNRDRDKESAKRLLIRQDLEDLIKFDKKVFYQYNADEDEFIQVTDEILDPQTIYFVQRDIEYLQDSNNESNYKYLSDVTYYFFEKMFDIVEKINPNSKYRTIKKPIFEKSFGLMPYTITVKLKNKPEEVIDLSLTTNYELKDFDNIELYQMSAGLYSDFTYSIQIKNYDLSKRVDLIELKQIVDAYNDILSQEAMQKYKIENKLTEYSTLLDAVYNGSEQELNYNYNGKNVIIQKKYQVVYKEYLDALDIYIQTLKDLEKEGA